MNGLAQASGAGIGEIALFALALLLFMLAVASGRWTVWLVAYAIMVLALALALFAGRTGRTIPDDEATASVARGQPCHGSGVLECAAMAGALAIDGLERNGTP